jgi:hypothetical protein
MRAEFIMMVLEGAMVSGWDLGCTGGNKNLIPLLLVVGKRGITT